ncbi:MAG: hypothetical protein L0G07_06800 [Chryseobacterium sp.]|nr:hypothetical protein [Chryseobacterium sp.]
MNRDKFIEVAGATKGHSKELFGRMYDALKSENINVIEEYEIFYSLEYDNLGSYLYRRWNMDYEMVEAIVQQLKENSQLLFFRRVERSYQGSALRNFMSEEPMIDRIEKILIMR